jgi:nucleobase:cation symporter-1, NCS1 family
MTGTAPAGTVRVGADARAAAEPIDGPVQRRMAAAARATGMVVCAGSFPELDGEQLRNTAVVYGPAGELLLCHRKACLYGAEPEVFRPGNAVTAGDIAGIGRVGLCVCFDGDFPETARALRDAGADLVLHPCAYEAGAQSWWDTIYPAQALCNGQKPRDLFTIWFSSNIMPLTFVTGALAPAVFGLSFWWSLIAILLGNVVGALFMALHSAQGPRLGVPQMIQSRAQFGYFGALLVVVVAVAMYVGFFASNLVLGGQSLNQLASGISVDTGMILSLIFIVAVHGLPGNFLSTGHFSGGGFLSSVSLGVLWQIAYAPYVSDYSRYMPPGNQAGSTFWMSYWGTVLGSVLPMVLGAIVGVASSNPDQIAELRTLSGGVGWLVMIVFALGIMDTNSINLYGGVLCSITTGQTFARNWIPGARVRAILSVAIVGLSLILAIGLQANFLANYTNFILLLLYVLIPWTAINLVDYYLIRHGEYNVEAFFDPSGGPYGRVGGIGIAAYIIGIAVEIPFMSTTLYTGPAASAMNGTDLSWIVGLVVTVPLYYLLASRQGTRHPAASPEPARN